MTINANQKKYEECIELLKQVHEIIALSLSLMDVNDLGNMSARELIIATLMQMEEYDKLSEEDKRELDKQLGLSTTSNTKNDVVVLVDENETKGIIQ